MSDEELRVISLEEVEQNNNAEKCWIVMHGKVYDVSEFIAEHPGGEDAIIEYAGKDATEAFDDVGHSRDASEMARSYLIGKLEVSETKHAEPPVVPVLPVPSSAPKNCPGFSSCIYNNIFIHVVAPVLLGVGAYVIYKNIKGRSL